MNKPGSLITFIHIAALILNDVLYQWVFRSHQPEKLCLSEGSVHRMEPLALRQLAAVYRCISELTPSRFSNVPPVFVDWGAIFRTAPDGHRYLWWPSGEAHVAALVAGWLSWLWAAVVLYFHRGAARSRPLVEQHQTDENSWFVRVCVPKVIWRE